jgi:5-methylcytosine-specific restriction endonuclease McrA
MSNTEAVTNNVCVQCHKPAKDFRDALSTKEFTISGLCQSCQDIAFAPCEDDEESKMTDEVQALENAEERIEEFKAATVQPDLVVDANTHMSRSEHVITCPKCNQQVKAVAYDGVVKGYCSVAHQYTVIKIKGDEIKWQQG